MIHINKVSKYMVEIQDINFLPMFIATNIESPTGESTSSLYSWSTEQPSGRISTQSMAKAASTTQNTRSSNSNEKATSITQNT